VADAASEAALVPLYEEGDQEPLDQAEHAMLLNRILEWQIAADGFREPKKRDWRREYLMYRSFVAPRRVGEWRSRMFIPISFWVIETQMPKLIAQLPQPIVLPVGPEDEEPARVMEERLKWAFDQSQLHLELVAAYRSALKYGTGILKVYPAKLQDWVILTQPVVRREEVELPEDPEIDPTTGQPMLDMDGNPLMTGGGTQEMEVPVLDATGSPKTRDVRQPFTYYQGPVAEALDIEDVWVSPEASSFDDTRYVIHQVYRELEEIEQLVKDGTYKLPEGRSIRDLWEWEDNPALQRQGELGESGQPDMTREPVRVWECWTKTGMVYTVLNERLIVRKARNPFAHGKVPFVRILDYFQEHEFYGTGELGPILGIQDAINSLWNSRIDNVRLVLQRVFAVNTDNLWDLRDLRLQPGGVIRMRSTQGINPQDLLYPIDFPDITGSAYEEVNELIGLVERVLSNSGYQSGVDSATMNDTATGVALITEQGNTRHATKVRMAELTGLVPLTRMFGSLLQQYAPESLLVRREGGSQTAGAEEQGEMGEGGPDIEGQQSEFGWDELTAAELQGNLDYDLEAGAQAQTDSVRKELDMTLWNLLHGATDAAGVPLVDERELLRDFLRSWGKKDTSRLIVDPQVWLQEQMAQQAALAPPGMGMEPGLAGGMGEPLPPEAEMAGAPMGF
jgi:hypothetical protein